ncbi:MAG: hypothetical protein AB1798_20965 [Spirochaetota bacterium]
MIAFKELQDIVKRTTGWERKLLDLYDVAEFGIKNKDSKAVIKFLKERQEDNLEILENIDVKKYGKTEWVRFASDYKDEELIPKRNIKKDSTPVEIFNCILEYENKLKDFYHSIFERLSTEAQKELFDSLVKFKDEQISRIKNLMERHYPAR